MEFKGRAKLTNRDWDLELEKPYSKKYKKLKQFLEEKLDKLLRRKIKGFTGIVVLAFWPGSVGFDYQVFVEVFSNATADMIKEVFQDANKTGNLSLGEISVERVTPTPVIDFTPPAKNRFETWKVVLLVVAALVITLLVVIILLLVRIFDKSIPLQDKTRQDKSTAQQRTAQHSTAQHSTAQHSTVQYSSAQRKAT